MFKPGAESGGGYRSEGPYGAPNEGPYGRPNEGPYGRPNEGPYGRPNEGPYGRPNEGPYGRPNEGPYGRPNEGPYGTPNEGPYGTPKPRTPETKPTPDKVERIQAKQIDVSAGRLRDDGRVVVERRTLGPDTRKIVIGRAAGMQIGEHNRQFNVHSYDVAEPTVSLDHLLDGHPLRQWAFEKVVANPDSSLANYVFRVFLPGEPVFSGGRIALPEMRGRPISAQFGPSGKIVLDQAWGAQVGDWNTQRNRFSYSLEEPELSLSEALRGRPGLVRSLAIAVDHPDNPAAQRSFSHQLSGAYSSSSWEIGNVCLPPANTSVVRVGGVGVQAGYGNVRKDTVVIQAGRVRLTGWEQTEAHRAEDAQRDQRLAAEHQDRISSSRPTEFIAGNLGQDSANLLHHVAERMAATALGQIAPGRDHLAARMAEGLKTALDNPEDPDRAHKARLRISYERGGLGYYFWTETPKVREYSRPFLEFVNLAEGDGTFTAGAVVCGSAASLAAARDTRILDAEALLAYVRQRVWDDRAGRDYRSVAPAFRAVQSLQVLIFLDLSAGAGLWVDVDPERQVPAASLLIEIDMSAGAPGRFRVFRP